MNISTKDDSGLTGKRRGKPRMAILRTFVIAAFATFLALPSMAQTGERKISGVVTDESGAPMPGATVVVKGTQAGAVTGPDGVYAIDASNDNILSFSFIGYITQDVKVGTRTKIDLKLLPSAEAIEEVQVIAYGVQKKVSVTGAIASVGSKDLVRSPNASVGNVMAGLVSGISSVQYSGQPGADDPDIYVRGIGSLDGERSKPLILVDGVERSFFRMDPNEIENVTVLKDASSTAVFGVRGANGVILVTTKRGHEGKTNISLSSSVGVVQAMRMPEMANSYDHAIYHNKMSEGDGTTPIFSQKVVEMFRTNADPIMFPDTDWSDLLFKKASVQTQHNLSISGGMKRVRYFISAGYLYQDGLLKRHYESYNPNWRTNRYNYRANIDIDVSKSTLLKVNIGGITEQRNEPNAGDQNNMWMEILRAQPFSSPGFIDGKMITNTNRYIPVVMRTGFVSAYGRGYREISQNTLNLDLQLTQKLDFLTKGLAVEVKGAYNSQFASRKTWSASPESFSPVYRMSLEHPEINFESTDFNDYDIVYQQSSTGSILTYSDNYESNKARDWYLEASVRYNRTFGDHSFGALLLYNMSKKYYMVQYPEIPRGYMGFVGRLTYAYRDKYLFDFNLGRNGSENFAQGKRFGTMPAFSVGWVISEENFMKNQEVIDFLKLRASYGVVGNDRYYNSAGVEQRFLYLPDSYVESSGGYNFGSSTPQNYPAVLEGLIGNRDVTWETARKQNYGLDLRMLGNRLSFSADVFFENRKDILIQQSTVPAIVAATLPVVNMGRVKNHGYELSLGWNHSPSMKFNYFARLNVSYATNKIKFMDEVHYDEPWKGYTGRRVGSNYGYIFDRFFEQNDFEDNGALKEGLPVYSGVMKPGDLMYKDLNKDGVIDDKDKAVFGYSDTPEYTFGLTAGFNYAGFDFSMLWTGATHVTRRMNEDFTRPFNTGNGPLMQFMIDECWTPERGQSADFPRLTQANKDHNSQVSSFWVRDASYLRLKNLEIGYSFKATALKKIGIESLRVYINGYNLLTFDGLDFIDPESKIGNANLYPNTRIFNCGVNINF